MVTDRLRTPITRSNFLKHQTEDAIIKVLIKLYFHAWRRFKLCTFLSTNQYVHTNIFLHTFMKLNPFSCQSESQAIDCHHIKTITACTVKLSINATTVMHKSTLSTNNFGNNSFRQKYQQRNILTIFRRLKWCLFEKFPTSRAKTRKCVFGKIFHFFNNFVTLKKYFWNFISSIDAPDSICEHKSFQKLFQNSS